MKYIKKMLAYIILLIIAISGDLQLSYANNSGTEEIFATLYIRQDKDNPRDPSEILDITPESFIMDKNENLYIADSEHKQILKISDSSEKVSVFFDYNKYFKSHNFDVVFDMAIDNNTGDLYLTDGGLIIKINQKGQATIIDYGSHLKNNNKIKGIYVDTNSNLTCILIKRQKETIVVENINEVKITKYKNTKKYYEHNILLKKSQYGKNDCKYNYFTDKNGNIAVLINIVNFGDKPDELKITTFAEKTTEISLANFKIKDNNNFFYFVNGEIIGFDQFNNLYLKTLMENKEHTVMSDYIVKIDKDGKIKKWQSISYLTDGDDGPNYFICDFTKQYHVVKEDTVLFFHDKGLNLEFVVCRLK